MSTQTFATDHTPVESLGQPYAYPPKREFYEPDWTRIHGWKNVTREEWEDAAWFTRDDLLNSPEDNSFRLPRKDSISRRLIEDWMKAD